MAASSMNENIRELMKCNLNEACRTQIELSISARNLPNMDTFSKSDPLCVVYTKKFGRTDWVEIKRTEVIENTLNPDFVTKVQIPYVFEEQQALLFEVYDADDIHGVHHLQNHDFIGDCFTSIGNIVTSDHSTQKLKLVNRRSTHSNNNNNNKHHNKDHTTKRSHGGLNLQPPTLIVRAEELQVMGEEEDPNTSSSGKINPARCEIELHFAGKKLDRKDLFGLSDPFLQISRCSSTITAAVINNGASSSTSAVRNININDVDNEFTIIHRTETVKSTVNPTWKTFTLPVGALCCNGDMSRLIRFECYDYNRNGDHSKIGEFFASINQLRESSRSNQMFQLDKYCTKNNREERKCAGQIYQVTPCKMRQRFSFLDYIRGGTQLACTFAIDFTSSNGHPEDQRSLHHVVTAAQNFDALKHDSRLIPKFCGLDSEKGQVLNQYEMALSAIGEIIEVYDSDKIFPVLGFGAKLPREFSKACHCFHVKSCEPVDLGTSHSSSTHTAQNDHKSSTKRKKSINFGRNVSSSSSNSSVINRDNDDEKQFVSGTEGVLEAYKSCIKRIQLFGPTNFAPTIQYVADRARESMDGSQYHILLILTDGNITDLTQTKSAIVDASELPMSIIIVGIGGANFDSMNELDADNFQLRTTSGKLASRDIVQFAPFSYHLMKACTEKTPVKAKLHLAKELLAEIPEQLISFMQSKSIVPKRRRRLVSQYLGGSTDFDSTKNVGTAITPPDPERLQYFIP